VIESLPSFHDESHATHGADVLEGMAFDGDDVGQLTWFDRADAIP
jgi:hypothetical protein